MANEHPNPPRRAAARHDGCLGCGLSGVPRLVPDPEKAGVGKQNAEEGDSRWSSSFVMVARDRGGFGSSLVALL